MSLKSKKQDWSSIVDQINAEETLVRSEGSQESVETPNISGSSEFESLPSDSHRDNEHSNNEEQDDSSKPLPHLAPSKSVGPRKTSNKLSFLDRLASINLFGTVSPEKADRSAAVPHFSQPSTSSFESRTLENIHGESDKSFESGQTDENVPGEQKSLPTVENATEKKPERVALTDVADPWSLIAKQINTHGESSSVDTPGDTDSLVETTESHFEPASNELQEEIEAKTHENEQNEYAIPDIEQLVSFRDLPPIKKKTAPEPSASPPGPVVISSLPPRSATSTATSKTFSFERPSSKSKDGDKDFDKKSTREAKDSKKHDSRKEKSFSAKDKSINAVPERTKSKKQKSLRSYDSPEKDYMKISSVYDEPMDLEELDLIAPSQSDSLPAYSLGSIEENDDEDITVLRSRKNRNDKKSKKLKKPREQFEETDDAPFESSSFDITEDDYSDTPRYAANYFEEVDDEDYEVITPAAEEREYGPPRDVFADLPDILDEELSDEFDSEFMDELNDDIDDIVFPAPPVSKGRASRSQRSPRSHDANIKPTIKPVVRQSFPGAGTVDSPLETHTAGETPSKGRLTRGSKVRSGATDHTKHSSDESDVFAGFPQKPKRGSVEKDESFEDEHPASEKKKVRTRTPHRKASEPDFRDERDEQEEEEMMRLHKAIPSWDDAILPIVESNTARRSQRRNTRKR